MMCQKICRRIALGFKHILSRVSSGSPKNIVRMVLARNINYLNNKSSLNGVKLEML